MNIQELLNRTDRFAANAGCQITEVDTEHAVAEMVVTNAHLNGANVCQGGALFTLADLAIAALMNARGLASATALCLSRVPKRAICFVQKPSAFATIIRFPPSKCASPIRKAVSSVMSQVWATVSPLPCQQNKV